MYKPIKLEAADAARMRALNDKVLGMRQAAEMYQQAGERRAAELAGEQRKLWEEFSAKYGFDGERVAYVPSNDGTEIVPISVDLRERGAQ